MLDNEIVTLQLNCEEKVALNKKLQTTIAEYDRELIRIRDSSIERDIRLKTTQVYNVTKKAIDYMLAVESKWGKGEKVVANMIYAASAKYDQKNFIKELSIAYATISKDAKYINSLTPSTLSTNVIKEIASAYANICNIKNNIDSLISRFVNEKQTKEQQIAEKKAEKERAVESIKNAIQKVDKDGQILLSDIKRKIAEIKEETKKANIMQATPSFSSSYSNPKWLLGFSMPRSEEKTVFDFPVYNTKVELPASSIVEGIDLKDGRPNVLIKYAEKDKESSNLWGIIKCLIMNFLLCYPGNSKRVAMMHDNNISEFVKIVANLNRCSEDVPIVLSVDDKTGACLDNNQFIKIIEKISDIINIRMGIMGERYQNILEYNAKNQDNIQPLILLVLKDIDFQKVYIAEKINSILQNGETAGVYTLMLNESRVYNSNVEKIKDIDTCFSNKFTYEGNGIISNSQKKIKCDNNLNNFKDSYYVAFNQAMKKGVKGIEFFDFHSKLNLQQLGDTRTAKIVPIGKHGNDVISIEFTSNTPHAHAIIEGKSGTGKSSLLHSILLSAAYHYSPEELEIWIIDMMKGGKDFEAYKQLKHVKYLALDSNSTDVYELMQYIATKYQGENQGDEQKPPKAIVAIDEYALMNKETARMLESLARQIRKYGVCLLLCSQDAPFDEVNNQMGHKFEMYKDGRYDLIKNATDYGELTPSNRMVVYEGKKTTQSMKFAYVGGNTDRIAAIEKINQKYAKFSNASEPVIIGKSRTLQLKDAHEIKDNNFYGYDWTIKVPLGQNLLTFEQISYKINSRNSRLMLFGDSERASNIEYLIAKTFNKAKTKEPIVFYLNFETRRKNAVLDKMDGANIVCTKRPLDCCEIIKKLYYISRRREEMLFEGEEIETPIEIIIHGADETARVLAYAEKQRGLASNASRTSYNYSTISTINERDLDNMSIEEMQALQRKLSENRQNSYDTNILDDYDSEIEDMSYADMLRELLDANADLKICTVIHFKDISFISKNSMYPHNLIDCKDVIVVPEMPQEGDEPTYAELQKLLIDLNQREFASQYDDRLKNNANEEDKRKERENFKNLILIDDHQAYKYVPYED